MEFEYSTICLINDLVNSIGSLPKASLCIGYGSTYLSDLKQRMTNPKVRGYNPDYKFSLNNLNTFKSNLRKRVPEAIIFLDKYAKKNKDLEDYSNQQCCKSLKVHFFQDINTLEKAYWLGFLYADGSVKELYREKPWYRILIDLSIKDRDQLVRFCNAIGLPFHYIKTRFRKKKYRGKIKTYYIAYVHFRCKPMVKDLVNLDFCGSKSNTKSLPPIFNDINNEFKRKLFLAWLLGFYDGDGEMNSTRISSSSREFLQEIKSALRISSKIGIVHEKGKKSYLEGVVAKKTHWRMALGVSVYKEMMQNYKNSMPRKRKE